MGVIRKCKAYPPAGDGAYGSSVPSEEIPCHPARQGSGIGTALLNTVEEYVKKHGLAGMTLSTNKYAPAPKFYKKNGFENCEHVIFMAKEM